MLDDLTPILKAASVVPIRVRRDSIPEEEQTTPPVPEFQAGCFNCIHGATNMSGRRRFATVVTYMDADGDYNWDNAIFGMVVSPDDTRIHELGRRHWLQELFASASSVSSRRGDMSNMSTMDFYIDRMLNDNTNLYVRKWVDFTRLERDRPIHRNATVGINRILTGQNSSGSRDTVMRALVYYPHLAPGVYIEPTDILNEWPMWDEAELMDFYRVSTEIPSGGSFLYNVLNATWADMYDGLESRAIHDSPYMRLNVGEINTGEDQGQERVFPSYNDLRVHGRLTLTTNDDETEVGNRDAF